MTRTKEMVAYGRRDAGDDGGRRHGGYEQIYRREAGLLKKMTQDGGYRGRRAREKRGVTLRAVEVETKENKHRRIGKEQVEGVPLIRTEMISPMDQMASMYPTTYLV